MSIFGKSHFVSNGIYGSNVISVETDQRNHKDVIITCSNCIRVYEPNERSILESWMFKSWVAPVSGCVTSSKGQFYCPVASNAILNWTADEKQLENLPQIKFGSSVSSLESVSGAVYVVFEGGCVEEISQAMFRRKVKRPKLLPASYVAEELQLGENLVTAIATSQNEGDSGSQTRSIFQYPVGCTEPSRVVQFQLVRPSLSLTGVCLLSYCRAVSLWSNGELCVSAVCCQEGNSQPALTVRPLGHLGGLVDCSRPARLLRMYDWVVAVLGLDVSKDGGRITLWDVENHVEIARRHFKLYQPSLRCWVGGVGGSGGAILLHEKQELTVVPLNRVPPRGLAPYVLGQTPVTGDATEELVQKDWGKTSEEKDAVAIAPSVTPSVEALMRQLCLHSLDLSLCVTRLVHEATERRSLALACEIMGSFKGALPERCIVDLITLLFAADSSELAGAAVKYVDIAGYGTSPPSLRCFFERLDTEQRSTLHSDSNSPLRKTSGKRKREESWSDKKKAKRARMAGTLNGHAELTNGGSPVSLLHNGVAQSTNQIPASKDEDPCPMFDGGWLLLHQLLCAPFTQEFMTKELRRLPFRNALSFVAYLERLRKYSPNLGATHGTSHIPQDGIRATHGNKHIPQDGIRATHGNKHIPQDGIHATHSPAAKQALRRRSSGAGGDGVGAEKLLQAVVPTTDVVVQWCVMLHRAHERAILLEMELQNAACLDDAALQEEEADAEAQLQLAHLEELLSQEAEREAAAPVALKTSLPDPLYSTEVITFPW